MAMGFVGLLNFAVACFDVLAWPLFALCYPLCVSIQAIEANSISDTKKLITYWVSFSLILLFEYAFEKLLEWLPSWEYIKLMIVFCLVMPHFHGSLYVYKHLVHPCLSVDPESVINQLIKLKDFFFKEDNLLAEMERDVKENGTDALENPIASKVVRPNHVVREIKAVPDIDLPNFEKRKIANNSIKVLDITQEKEVISPHQVRYIEPNLPMVDNRASAPHDLKEIATAVEAGKNLPEIPASEQVQKQWTCAICQLTVQSETDLNSHLQGRRHKAACELLNEKKQKPKSEAIPCSAGKKSNVPSSNAAAARKDLVVRPNRVVWEIKAVPNIDLPNFEKQKIANNSIKVLDITQEKEVISPHQVRYIEPNLPMVDNRASAPHDLKEIATAVEAGKNLPEIPAPEQVQKQWTCAICQLTVQRETDLNSHLQGRRHKAACELLNEKKQKPKSEAIPSSAGKKSNVPSSTAAAARKDLLGISFPSKDVQNDWTCTLCNLKLKSEIAARSHVYGKRHKAACEELKAKVRGEIKNNTPWWCIVCNVSCTSQGDLDCHLAGNKHLARTRELNSDGGSE